MKWRIYKIALRRGREKAAWAEELYEDLKSEFERMNHVGAKFKMNLLLLLARKLVNDSTLSLYSPYITNLKS